MDISHLITRTVFKFVKDPAKRWDYKKNFPQVFFLPHMKPDEYELFRKICKNKKVFLEFGSGGSTIQLLKKNKEVYSVESNPDFYEFMKSLQIVNQAIDKNLHYEFIDLGSTNKWGKPILMDQHQDWSEYYTKIWKSVDTKKHKVDVIFIDGRFRVCCCLHSILKVLENGWEDTTFMIHDFWRREQYHVVLKFLNETVSSRNLAVFTLKENIDATEVKAALSDYALATQ